MNPSSNPPGGPGSPRRDRLAAKLRAMERHLVRVETMLPAARAELIPMTAACDAVTLHLWQAVQLAIDVAVGECAARGLGTPPDYASAFRLLRDVNVLPPELTERLVRAVGFRNVIAMVAARHVASDEEAEEAPAKEEPPPPAPVVTDDDAAREHFGVALDGRDVVFERARSAMEELAMRVLMGA